MENYNKSGMRKIKYRPKSSETHKGRKEICRKVKLYFTDNINFIHTDKGFPFIWLINTPNSWGAQKITFNKDFNEVLNNYDPKWLEWFWEIINNEEKYECVNDGFDAYFIPKDRDKKDENIMNIKQIFISTKARKPNFKK